MEVVTDFDRLESKLDAAEKAAAVSDNAFRQSLASWYLSPALVGQIPADPFSHEYETFQRELYKRLANKEYDIVNEATDFDFDHSFLWPYPYSTKSAQTVGIHLMGYGWLIRKMNLPPESRILEIGSGFGPLTVHLASMGYRVTCLDISEPLLDFVKARTAHLPQPVKTICGDMATAELGGPYDAVIFNASLHHSFEHREIVQRLDSILIADGIVAFTAEPVVADNSRLLPYPWGIRLDGLGIWAVCKEGWLELGFQESYFIQVLNEAGWKLKRADLGISGQTDVWIGSREGESASLSVENSTSRAYDVDLETEVIRLRSLVEGYERGKFIRFMKWLNSST